VQTQRLVDDGVQQRHSHEVVVRQARQRVEGRLQLARRLGMPRQLEEDVCQRGGDRVAPRDDDQLRVSMQVVLVQLRLLALVVSCQEPVEDVWMLGLVLRRWPCMSADCETDVAPVAVSSYLGALVNLVLDPVPELQVVEVEDRSPLEEGEQPGQVGEEGDVEHVGADGLEDVGLFSVADHVRVLVEGEVFHDIEDEEVEPLRDVDRLVVVAFDDVKKVVDGGGDAVVVPVDGFLMSVYASHIRAHSAPFVVNP
jgi:hypothetical protein